MTRTGGALSLAAAAGGAPLEGAATWNGARTPVAPKSPTPLFPTTVAAGRGASLRAPKKSPVPTAAPSATPSVADLTSATAVIELAVATAEAPLAVAGALLDKRVAPAGLGTMRTDTPTFAGLTLGTVVIVGALTFLPALLLGPAVQGLTTHLF